MKLLKIIVGISAGVVFAALLCWGGLYAFEAFMLRSFGRDSTLFDANAQGANAFFVTWACMGMIQIFGRARSASRP